MKLLKRLLLIVAFILIFVQSCSILLTGNSAFATHLSNVRQLERVLPVLEKYQVVQFRNQNWCRNFFYEAGQFSDLLNNDNCNLRIDQPQPFTSHATLDFLEVKWALSSPELRIRIVTAQFDEQGRILHAEFDVDCLFCYGAYVYEPQYKQLPSDNSNKPWVTIINGDWYYLVID